MYIIKRQTRHDYEEQLVSHEKCYASYNIIIVIVLIIENRMGLYCYRVPQPDGGGDHAGI